MSLAVAALALTATAAGCELGGSGDPTPPVGTAAPRQAPPGPLRVDRAQRALERLSTATPGAPAGYDRDAFGAGWLDLDSDGCNTREEVLARDMRSEVRPDGCNVETGVLTDPYTGARIEFVEDTDPSRVQVDHVYPLAYAWAMGAWGWTEDKRERFANDALGLLAVDGPTNNAKGAAGPASWRPPARTGWCLYSVRFTRTAAGYDLPVSSADVTALRDMLATCP